MNAYTQGCCLIVDTPASAGKLQLLEGQARQRPATLEAVAQVECIVFDLDKPMRRRSTR